MVKSETRRDAEILVRNPSSGLFGKKFRVSKKVKTNHAKSRLRDFIEYSRLHLVFAFQTRSRLKYKQKTLGLKKTFFRSTSITLFSNKKCFCFKAFFLFWGFVKNFAFCYQLAFVSSGLFLGVWVKMPREWMKLKSVWLHDLWLSLFAHSSSSPEKKYIKQFPVILLADP